MTNEQRYKIALENLVTSTSSGNATVRIARRALQPPEQPSLDVLIYALKKNNGGKLALPRALVIFSDGSAALAESSLLALGHSQTFDDCAAVMEHLSYNQ